MTAAVAELQKAIFAALGDAAPVVDKVGGRIHDQAPAAVQFPYVTFGRTSLYDWSTGTESGTEQLFTLHIWSKAKGKKETLDIMEAIRARLDHARLPLDTQHLVDLTLEFAEARHDDDLSVHHGLLRFRAITESSQQPTG
jgi:Protein of unknown function (DUF3168)